MAEQASSTALAVIDAEYVEVKDYDASGKTSILRAELPTTSDFAAWSLKQQVVMLKKGMWNNVGIADILWGLTYARGIDADVIKGDLFPTGVGRWGTSNKYKIRKALETGNIVGIETDIRDTGERIDLAGCVHKTDLECTVTIHVKGWVKPIVRKARLSRWFKKTNPNWQGNPEHMLELNTIAHACEYVHPTTTGDDEAPPALDPAVPQAALAAAKLEAEKETA